MRGLKLGVAGVVALLIGAGIVLPASASAAAPELLFQVPANSQTSGTGAGQLNNPRAIVTNPMTGHIYVGDTNNFRIGQFTPWGEFVRAWGWDVASEGVPGDTAANELETCTSVCQAGASGKGPGQFALLTALAIDDVGSVYAYDQAGRSVQKFNAEGGFEWMIGREVNKDTLISICTKADLEGGDECEGGTSGTGDGEFSSPSFFGVLTYNPVTDTIFVGDTDRIQEISTDGEYLREIEFDGPFDANYVYTLTADQVSGDLYLAFPEAKPVYRIDSGLAVLDEPADAVGGGSWVEVGTGGSGESSAKALATDVEGNLYVVNGILIASFAVNDEVLGFDPMGEPVAGMEEGDRFAGYGRPVGNDGPSIQDSIAGLATNTTCPDGEEQGSLYVPHSSGVRSFFDAYGGSPICFEDPPLRDPLIEARYALDVDVNSATLKAQINPFFWTDTTYHVQYGTADCVDKQGWQSACVTAHPTPPGVPLSTLSTNKTLTTAPVRLEGLVPATAYRYRFVAASGGSQGEPIFGEPGTFKTFAPADSYSCSNDTFRIGPAAALPDCRAYEMVSPLDKNNADIVTEITAIGVSTALRQSAPTGERLTYSAATSFGDSHGAAYTSQYLAERDPGSGWETDPISPPRTRGAVNPPPDREFRLFTEDLCLGWLETTYDPILAPGAIPGYRNLYRRANCGPSGFEALSIAQPDAAPEDFKTRPQGASADGSRSIFVANDDLPGTGAPVNNVNRLQLYSHSADAGLEFVCRLPNSNAVTQACYAGTIDEGLLDDNLNQGNFRNAISANGDRVFWTQATDSTLGYGPGRIFVRFASEPGSRSVSQSVSSANARFYGASEGGDRALFAIEDINFSAVDKNFYSFDVAAEEETLIAEDLVGVMGMSDDAHRVYFASTQAIAGSGENSEEDEAQAGQVNLYLWEEGEEKDTVEFVARLTTVDANNAATLIAPPSPLAKSPLVRTSRVSPDGLHAAFSSTGSPTDYDNTDALSGEADLEVFRYDATSRQLNCVSCNPSGARPSGGDVRRSDAMPWVTAEVWAAAWIPGWDGPYRGSRALSDDGDRVFFNSFDALIPRDTNGAIDVYQWQAQGSGTCTAQRASFAPDSGGCIELISSGQSPLASTFVDASATGDDVFISTAASLIPPDFGLVDIYDARVGGGFHYPEPKGPCEGDACQPPASPPDAFAPSSSSFRGEGNVSEAVKPKPRCPKGKRRAKRRGKAVCVPRKSKATGKQKRANKSRRAAR